MHLANENIWLVAPANKNIDLMPQPIEIIAFMPQTKTALLDSIPEHIETIGLKNRDPQLWDKQIEI